MVANKLAMQDWTVELRQRMQGAHQGDVYAVFVDSKGQQYYTKTLACA